MTALLPPDELEKRRVGACASHPERKTASEARVVRWEWATGRYHSFTPLDAECGGWQRGKLCKKAPADVKKMFAFGFDEDDRLCFIREHTKFDGCCNDTFVDAEDPQWVWRDQHRKPNEPQTIMQRVFEEGMLLSIASKSRFGHTARHYEWREGRIAAIKMELDTGDVQNYAISYRGGLLREVCLVGEGVEPHVVYTSHPPDLKTLLSALEARLAAVVRQRVGAATFAGPAFCLVLSYSEESQEEMALPALSVGLESERARWRGSGDSASDLWNPAGFSTHGHESLELDDAELGELAAELAQGLRAPKDYKAVKKTYLTVAKALNDVEWSTVLSTTDDFKVLAVSVDMADLKANFKAILGAGPAKELARGGLL